ncbi:hypothetical protein BURK2_00821 [Burkholderiales bacterium]|nr:MAG: hypothetical protein F9K47_04500 [Burkholderiales bacterium]CAG0962600.1 hypothetical protein BURK2_00821 [Burkholderiales bacterium]
MLRSLTLSAILVCCTACGVQETTTAAAVGAAAKAQEAQAASQTISRAQSRLDEAARTAAESRRAAE